MNRDEAIMKVGQTAVRALDTFGEIVLHYNGRPTRITLVDGVYTIEDSGDGQEPLRGMTSSGWYADEIATSKEIT